MCAVLLSVPPVILEDCTKMQGNSIVQQHWSWDIVEGHQLTRWAWTISRYATSWVPARWSIRKDVKWFSNTWLNDWQMTINKVHFSLVRGLVENQLHWREPLVETIRPEKKGIFSFPVHLSDWSSAVSPQYFTAGKSLSWKRGKRDVSTSLESRPFANHRLEARYKDVMKRLSDLRNYPPFGSLRRLALAVRACDRCDTFLEGL